jgi:hypothetical protein
VPRSELDRLCGGPRNGREFLIEWLEFPEYRKERRSSHRLYDQTRALFAQNRFVPGQLEVARDTQGLVAAVLEEPYVTFRIHQTSTCRRHMPYIC